MSINFNEFVGMSALTWEQVYEAFKARLIEELAVRSEHDPDAEPDWILVERYVQPEGSVVVKVGTGPSEVCSGCGMHYESHTWDCPEAGLGRCVKCGQDLTGDHLSGCPDNLDWKSTI
jgi:hypothetical protein